MNCIDGFLHQGGYNIDSVTPAVDILTLHTISTKSWDNVVGIATCYGLDGPGIESW